MTAPAFDLALDNLNKSKDPVSDILRTSAYWIPLQFVYCQMVKNKDIVMLSELPAERKQEYWNMVKSLEKPKWVKINLAQALYVYDYIKANPE